MSYDWHKSLNCEEGSQGFYDEVDRRFTQASPFYRGIPPFRRLICFDHLREKRVLEIGCGLGTHAELLSRAGCALTAIDLTKRSVELTRRRFDLKGLHADIQLMDAEEMDFRDNTFDFVWCWGVIQHSAKPERIFREVYRVLKPGGEFRFMVYHRHSFAVGINFLRGLVTGKFPRKLSFYDILNLYSDGYIARFYTRDEMSRLLLHHKFTNPQIRILGQKSELLPLPGNGILSNLKTTLLELIPDRVAESLLSAVGSFLFAVTSKPV